MNPKVLVVQKHAMQNSLTILEQWISLGNKNDCHFIIFPEYMNGIFSREEYSSSTTASFKKSLQQLAQEYHIAIIGSFLDEISGSLANVAYLIGEDGMILGNHTKIALTKYYESDTLLSGNACSAFPTRFGNVGMLICRDLLYPQLSSILARKEAKIVFCPAFWSYDATAYQANHAFLRTQFPPDADFRALRVIPQTRAIENEFFMVVANAAGAFKAPTWSEYLAGHSSVSSPLYGTLQMLQHHNEGYLIQELDFDILHDSKVTFSVRDFEPRLP